MRKNYEFNAMEGTFDIAGAVVEYLQASKANDQTNIDTDDNVIFDTVDRSAGSNITLDTGTGKFTLSAGKTYKLTCGLRFEHTSAAKIGFAWYDITNSIEISERARIHTMSEAGEKSNLPVIQAIITPTVEIEVSVRCVWDGDDVEDINAGYAWAIIEKIAETTSTTRQAQETLVAFTPTITGTTIGSGSGQVNPINFYKETITIGGLTKVIVTGRFDHYQEDDPVTIDLSSHMSLISSATITPNDHLIYESMMGISLPAVNKVKINRADGISGESLCSVVIVGIE